MKIAFYAPFKPLGHPHPSGDQVIARGLVQFLKAQGHAVEVQSDFRARWVYLKPWTWPALIRDFLKTFKRLKAHPPDLWLTYHTYYKSPDLLGPWICRLLHIRYVIFQGIYSTKQQRRFRTIAGFYLNRAALKQAGHVFTNKLSDLENLKRIIPQSHLTYIRPGIYPDRFIRDIGYGQKNRTAWGIPDDCPVILSACMFRDDVKTQGLGWMIQCLERLVVDQIPFHLVIAGSGVMKDFLTALAQQHIPGHFTFAGKISRQAMYQFYSAGDLFAFPGIRESLGMVFLEAQSCGLPVLAFDNGGIPEVVCHGHTGYLLPMYDKAAFSGMLIRLLENLPVRQKMGRAAAAYVRYQHDIDCNYRQVETVLAQVVGGK